MGVWCKGCTRSAERRSEEQRSKPATPYHFIFSSDEYQRVDPQSFFVTPQRTNSTADQLVSCSIE